MRLGEGHALLHAQHRQHGRQRVGVHAGFVVHGHAGQLVLDRPTGAWIERV